MKHRALIAKLALAVLSFATPAMAEDTGFGLLGYTNFTSNDAYGDRQDRWQSASNQITLLFGPTDMDSAPYEFGKRWELRSGFQIISPANTQTPAAGDRQMAGVLRSVVYTHAQRGDWDLSLGAGVEVVGPATQVTNVQDKVHQILNADRVAASVLSNQIGNQFALAGSAEAAYRFALTDKTTFRPFGELRGGLESYARVGADLIIGQGLTGGQVVRDYVTGLPYQIVERPQPFTTSFLIGGDMTAMLSSQLLPGAGYMEPYRGRLRAGVFVESKYASVFYGASYLTPEFSTQPEGQIVGALQIQFNF